MAEGKIGCTGGGMGKRKESTRKGQTFNVCV